MPITDELCSMLSELGQFLFLIEQELFKVRVFGKQWLNRAQGILSDNKDIVRYCIVS